MFEVQSGGQRLSNVLIELQISENSGVFAAQPGDTARPWKQVFCKKKIRKSMSSLYCYLLYFNLAQIVLRNVIGDFWVCEWMGLRSGHFTFVNIYHSSQRHCNLLVLSFVVHCSITVDKVLEFCNDYVQYCSHISTFFILSRLCFFSINNWRCHLFHQHVRHQVLQTIKIYSVQPKHGWDSKSTLTLRVLCDRISLQEWESTDSIPQWPLVAHECITASRGGLTAQTIK